MRRTTRLAACILGGLLVGCASAQRQAARIARTGGLEPVSLQGTGFQHHSFAAVREPADLLVLFIEGDGSPWIGGRRIAADPTPHVPLALELAVATPNSVLYLGRPCYMESKQPVECSNVLWTGERYSAAVVASMVAAAAGYIADHRFQRVLLVGYSGGGALAVLMAPRLPHAVGVVTIAGNLDPDAWTALHGYLPLEGSLNPALEPPLPEDVRQWYLVGERDTNVPAAATLRFFRRVSSDRIWAYSEFDHVCCWVAQWPSSFARIRVELQESMGSGSGQ